MPAQKTQIDVADVVTDSNRRGVRPRLLDTRISAACTQKQRDEIRAAARVRALTVSEFLLLNSLGLPLPRALQVSREALQLFVQLGALIDLLRSDSRNLNQVALHLNQKALEGLGVVGGDVTQALQSVEDHRRRVVKLDAALVQIRVLLNPMGRS